MFGSRFSLPQSVGVLWQVILRRPAQTIRVRSVGKLLLPYISIAQKSSIAHPAVAWELFNSRRPTTFLPSSQLLVNSNTLFDKTGDKAELKNWGQSLKALVDTKNRISLLNVDVQKRLITMAPQLVQSMPETDPIRILFSDLCVHLAELRRSYRKMARGTVEEAYEAAIALNPNNENAKTALSIWLGIQGRPGGAKIYWMPNVYERAAIEADQIEEEQREAPEQPKSSTSPRP